VRQGHRALHAALTMDTNTLSNDCAGADGIGSGRVDYGSGGIQNVPEPATLALLASGAVGFQLRRQSSGR
jgi:type VI secretion system secreted protein VgrG